MEIVTNISNGGLRARPNKYLGRSTFRPHGAKYEWLTGTLRALHAENEVLPHLVVRKSQ